MGIKRVVDVAFWTDGKVDEFSPEDKYFMLYLLTNPFSRQLGIYEISVKQAAFQMGYSPEAVKTLIDRFEQKYKIIRFSPETSEIAIINFLRHSILKGGKPVEDCIKNDISKVKDKRLIDFIFSRLAARDDLNATVRKVIDEYILENDLSINEIQEHNEIQNENDRSGYESLTNRYRIVKTPKKSEKPTRHKYGEYKNVLLTDDELSKLKSEFSDYDDRIERLSAYIESTGKKYKNHLATIRNWAKRDAEQTAQKTAQRTAPAYRKQTKADELDDAYRMMAQWSEE